jgi:hypothetical protein
MQNGATAVKRAYQSPKRLNIVVIWFSSSTAKNVTKRNEKYVSVSTPNPAHKCPQQHYS